MKKSQNFTNRLEKKDIRLKIPKILLLIRSVKIYMRNFLNSTQKSNGI